jgi:intracellular sulfur oxidation DsrE/DsrF family protein
MATKTKLHVDRNSCMTIMAVFLTINIFAQTTPQMREERFKKMEPKMIYPMIKGSFLSGILPVEGITNKPDPAEEVKLMFDFTQATSEGNQANKVNEGLEEVARVMNLHVAAGVPKEKIKTVVVFHAGSILTVMHDAFYQKNFQATNPNIPLLEKLKEAGCTFVICGQSLALREIPSDNLLPFIEVAMAAKTTLTKYHALGYFKFEVKGG